MASRAVTTRSASATVAERARIGRAQRSRFLAVRLASLAIALAVWQIYGMHSIAIVFQPITAVVADGVQLFATGGLGGATLYSVATFLAGLLIGSVLGIAVGLLTSRFALADAALSVYIFALYATPMVAIVPLITIWLGFGLVAQLTIIVMFVFFPTVVNVYNGTKQVDPALLEVGRAFRCTELQVWRHIVLPSVVPYIMTGLSQGVAMGLVGMYIAEIYTALSGMGAILSFQANAYHTGQVLAVILVIMVIGVVMRWGVGMLQRRVSPWFRTEES
jgi:sulfonate transport system permease protein